MPACLSMAGLCITGSRLQNNGRMDHKQYCVSILHVPRFPLEIIKAVRVRMVLPGNSAHPARGSTSNVSGQPGLCLPRDAPRASPTQWPQQLPGGSPGLTGHSCLGRAVCSSPAAEPMCCLRTHGRCWAALGPQSNPPLRLQAWQHGGLPETPSEGASAPHAHLSWARSHTAGKGSPHSGLWGPRAGERPRTLPAPGRPAEPGVAPHRCGRASGSAWG